MDELPGPVPLGDAEVAARIARAAASGRAADRRPTPRQLVAAFGEAEPTEAARRRAAAALELAGVRVQPDLLQAPADERVELQVAAAAGGGPPLRRALLGLGAVAAVLVVGAGAAALVGGDGDESVGEALPETAAPPTLPVTTATTETATTPRTTTTATRPRKQRPRPARRRRTVKVRVDASARPTFLCVEDGEGRQLFGGTLGGRRIFQARVVRLNIGLATTVVKYGRVTVPLRESPAGLVITPRGHSPLALGERPCA